MIRNIHILTDPNAPATQVREGKTVSRHVVVQDEKKFVFGWDQPLLSFFLQVNDTTLNDPEDNPIVWLGATFDTPMYEVEDLVNAAKKYGLDIPIAMQTKLYGEKDDGI